MGMFHSLGYTVYIVQPKQNKNNTQIRANSVWFGKTQSGWSEATQVVHQSASESQLQKINSISHDDRPIQKQLDLMFNK